VGYELTDREAGATKRRFITVNRPRLVPPTGEAGQNEGLAVRFHTGRQAAEGWSINSQCNTQLSFPYGRSLSSGARPFFPPGGLPTRAKSCSIARRAGAGLPSQAVRPRSYLRLVN
jgi:hypothetical protein